jgi:hypothetical protein
MSPETICAEDLFLDWLLALPDRCDPADAATTRLAEMRHGGVSTPLEMQFCELLRQTTLFSVSAAQRRNRRAPRPVA